MRRLVLFLVVALSLIAVGGAFDWWVDPYGDIYKPAALTQALEAEPHCLISQELVGGRYLSFKLDVFHRRPVRTFVVGSSRVLRIQSHPGETSFANMGFPGTAPETILTLFRSLPASPAQTVYIGVEAFWFNRNYAVPLYRPSWLQLGKYLLSWSTFKGSIDLVRAAPYVLRHRWQHQRIGTSCVLDRTSGGISWNVDGSREWAFELDPVHGARPTPQTDTSDLTTFRSGYYLDWTSFDQERLRILEQALALAKARGWRVVGFAPPELPRFLHLFETDPRFAGPFDEFRRIMPGVFRRYGFRWLDVQDASSVPCTESEFPDLYHSGAACSARIRRLLDAAAAR